jgi:hypothetical protein
MSDITQTQKTALLKIPGFQDIHKQYALESKMTGKLSKVEKEKLEWLELNTKIPCYISKKGEKRGAIIYESFKERYQNKGGKTDRQEAKE